MANWSERELEDWLWEHPEALGCQGLRWIGRQVPLPSGQRVDLLGVTEHKDYKSGIIIAELKAVTADGEALSQLLSYLHVFRTAIYERSMDFLPEYVESQRDVCRRENPAVKFLDPYGFLVAPDFTTRVLLSAESSPVACKFARQAFSFNDVNYNWLEEHTRADWPDDLVQALRNALSSVE